MLLKCPNIFWPLYVAVLLMALKSAGRLLREQTFERQVSLPAAAHAFHFSNRTWKHVARWWNRVERETWVKADLRITFYLLNFRLHTLKKADDFECKYSILVRRRSLTHSVSFNYRLLQSLFVEWSIETQVSWLYGRLEHVAFSQSEVVCHGFFLCAFVTYKRFAS